MIGRISIVNAVDRADWFPATSVCLEKIKCRPMGRSDATVKDQSPLPSAVVVPKELDPANSSTVLPASAVPVKVGVVSPVILSVLELPVSEEGARSGVDGASGAVVSTLIVRD